MSRTTSIPGAFALGADEASREAVRGFRYQVCVRCVMDTSDPDITFDSAGVCHHCTGYLAEEPTLPRNRPDAKERLAALAARVRRAGEGRRYDCVIGVSGGLDSSYVAHLVKRNLGLRPLAVHVDNGWNSELAVSNIERLTAELEIDLLTTVLDWNEFRSLQLAFLRASTPDAEIPTDHAITTCLYRAAAKEGLHDILSGNNFSTERIAVPAWSQGHSDWRYIKAVNARFGMRPLKTFPHRSALGEFNYRFLRRVRNVRILDYVPFDKAQAQALIERSFGWRDPGDKHYESLYTKFFQGYLLPCKFGFDKRRMHLSNLVCAGLITRDAALATLQRPAIDDDAVPELKAFVTKKMGLDDGEMDAILAQPPKRFKDFPSYQNSRAYHLMRALYRMVFEPVILEDRRAGR